MSDSSKETPSRQFSLRGLLWFVVACSAYFSMLGETIRSLQSGHEPGWRSFTTVIVCWAILLLFLRSKGVRGMVVAHCTAPAFLLPFCLFFLVKSLVAGEQISPLSVRGLFAAFAVVCFVSALVSFPVSVLQMLLRAFASDRRG